MKRLWKWFLDVFPYDKAYSFHRRDSVIDGTVRLTVEFYQDVYRRRRVWSSHYWRGTILVRVVLAGVGFRGRGEKDTTSSLRGTQEYTLRCDNDYVEILKHLAALEVRGMLTPAERLRVVAWQDIIMMMWPPRSGYNIHDFEEKYDSEQA